MCVRLIKKGGGGTVTISNNAWKHKGFTLVEILIVTSIIGILAAITIPTYIGAQEKARKSTLNKAAKSATADISHWLNSALKGVVATNHAALKEVDTDWTGSITAADMDNATLFGVGANAADSVAQQYPTARAAEGSPWATLDTCGAATLFTYVAVAPVAPASPCTVNLSPAGPSGNQITVNAHTNGPGGTLTASAELLSTATVTAE